MGDIGAYIANMPGASVDHPARMSTDYGTRVMKAYLEFGKEIAEKAKQASMRSVGELHKAALGEYGIGDTFYVIAGTVVVQKDVPEASKSWRG